jgi:boron transporter
MAPDSQRQTISTDRTNRQSGSIRRRSSASRHRAVIISGGHDGLQNLVSSEQSQSVSKFNRFRIHPFSGMWKDIRRRLPYYPSDWTDAWTYRVIPSTIDMYFKKYSIFGDQSDLSLLPAIAFALDMFQQTNNNFGVNEVLLSSVLAAVIFSLLAGQPLCIVGVTGTSAPSPINFLRFEPNSICRYRSNYSFQLHW